MYKKYKNYIIIFFSLFSTTFFAQSFIFPSWEKPFVDTTLKENATKSALYTVLMLNNDEAILTSNAILGWSVQRVNLKTGKVIWQNSRHQYKPVVGKDTYLYLDTFINSDGNVEIIGIRSTVPYPLIFIRYGYLVRNVFDVNTGKELEYLFDTKKNAYIYSSVITPYFKENNNTSYVMDSRVNGKQTLMLGTVDSNLVFKDTIAFFDKGLDPAQKSLGFNFANAHRVGDKIFAISFLLGGNYDTTGFRHIFSSYDIKTKTKFERELSKDLLYYINNIRFVNISDGILHSGYTDTTLSILKVGAAKNPKYMGKVSKINVDGNVEWTTFVPHPLPLSESFYGRVVASEDTIRKGYWVMAGSDDNDTIPIKLLFFNRKGKITKEALIKKKPIQQGQFPQNIFALSNGGLTGNYFYYDCSAQYDTCFKVFYFEKPLLDALFKTEVATVFLEENIFNLFPNPAVNNINIHFAEVINNATINIINSQGQTIRNYKLRNEQDLTIETSFLENGIYFACFYDDNNRFSCKKFVVNH